MLLNPFLLVFSAALALGGILWSVGKRPGKPYLSGIFLLLLGLFLGCTAVVNSALTPMPHFDWANEQVRRLVPFVTFQDKPTPEQLVISFQRYRALDIALFVGMGLSVIFDVWNALMRTEEPKKNNPKRNHPVA